jgi:hypothetical protein
MLRVEGIRGEAGTCNAKVLVTEEALVFLDPVFAPNKSAREQVAAHGRIRYRFVERSPPVATA